MIGKQGKHVPSSAAAPGCGPQPHDMNKHVTGSGIRPGTGARSGAPTPSTGSGKKSP